MFLQSHPIPTIFNSVLNFQRFTFSKNEGCQKHSVQQCIISRLIKDHFRSSMNTPYHCGFFLKVWDQVFQTCYPQHKQCFCAECARWVGVWAGHYTLHYHFLRTTKYFLSFSLIVICRLLHKVSYFL